MKTAIRSLLLLITASTVCLRLAHGQDAADVVSHLASLTGTGATNVTMSLTIRECIARALQNNLDIRIQRMSPSISSWGIVGAQGVFDPLLSASTRYQDSVSPASGSFISSIITNGGIITTNFSGSSRNLLVQPSVGLSGDLPTGARYDLSASPSGSGPTMNNAFDYNGSAVLSGSQPLLKNFGLDINTSQIRIARKSRDIAVQNFLTQVINTVSSVENAYYELVFTIEDYKSKQEDLALSKQLLDETRRKVQIGVASPLDVTTAESGVAQREEAVIKALGAIHDNQNVLKLLISQNVTEFRNVAFVPVDYPITEIVDTDVDRSTQIALQKRPDYISAMQSVERQNIQIKFNRNQLWPEVDLLGSYGWNGTGHTFGDWSTDVASRDNPQWSAGMSITFPLGNRQARANYQSARLSGEQLLLQLKLTEQQIVVGVDNAVARVHTALKSVEAASVARRLAEESYQAERTKLQAGTSTTLNVLTQQSALADARSAEIRARADYSESLIALAQTEGTTLDRSNIILDQRF